MFAKAQSVPWNRELDIARNWELRISIYIKAETKGNFAEEIFKCIVICDVGLVWYK